MHMLAEEICRHQVNQTKGMQPRVYVCFLFIKFEVCYSLRIRSTSKLDFPAKTKKTATQKTSLNRLH